MDQQGIEFQAFHTQEGCLYHYTNEAVTYMQTVSVFTDVRPQDSGLNNYFTITDSPPIHWLASQHQTMNSFVLTHIDLCVLWVLSHRHWGASHPARAGIKPLYAVIWAGFGFQIFVWMLSSMLLNFCCVFFLFDLCVRAIVSLLYWVCKEFQIFLVRQEKNSGLGMPICLHFCRQDYICIHLYFFPSRTAWQKFLPSTPWWR